MALGTAAATPGVAQTSSLLIAPLPVTGSYDRGHNESVLQRGRPEYDPLGVRVASFVVNPQLTTSLQATNNAFYNNRIKRSDVFLQVEPFVSVASDWSRHQLRLTGAADLRRYANQTIKNQDAWYLRTESRFDLTTDLVGELNASAARTFENPYLEDVAANVTGTSTFFTSNYSAGLAYSGARSRVTGRVGYAEYSFNRIRLPDGGFINQNNRDRSVTSTALIYEVGVTPSLGFFVRGEYERNNYDNLLFGRPNRDSDAYRGLFGGNFDVAGAARGTIGIGYSRRVFDTPALYRNVDGLSVEGQVEWFATPLSTVTIQTSRRLVDATNQVNVGVYWETRGRLRIDHELLYNMIVTAVGEVARRSYPEVNTDTRVYQAEISARYQARRGFSVGGAIGYASSDPSTTRLGNPSNELRGRVSITIRR